MTALVTAVLRRARAVDAALLRPVPERTLVLVHALVAVVIGLRLLGRDWTLVAARPPVLTGGPTPFGGLPVTVPIVVLVGLQVVGLLGVGLVLARVRVRLGFAVAWAAYVVLAALWGSSGKVMHDDVLTVLVGAALLVAHVPARARTGAAARSGWVVHASLAVVGCVYLLTGLQKLVHSGPAWAFGENMAWVLRQGTSPFGDGLTRLVADQPLLTRALATGALVLELSAPVWLAVRATRVPFAVAVALMHASIWAFLGLDYSAWALTLAAVAVPSGLRPVLRASPSKEAVLPPRPRAEPTSRRGGTPDARVRRTAGGELPPSGRCGGGPAAASLGP